MIKKSFTLPESAQPHFYFANTRKIAFTLAEVLITLGIIGIVAAMTLPGLIQNYQKKQAVEQLKVAFAIIENALNLAQLENGEYKDWQYYDVATDRPTSSMAFTDTYLSPYLKNVKIYNASKFVNCPDIVYKNLDGSVTSCTGVSAFCQTCGSTNSMSQLHLSNGGIVVALTRVSPDYGAEIHIDVNGYKGPNQWGKDIFKFELGTFNDFKLGGSRRIESTRDSFLNHCKNTDGMYDCHIVIMKDEWQIAKDYPWK